MVAQMEVVAVHGFEKYLEGTFQRCKLPIISFFLFKLAIGNSFLTDIIKSIKMTIKLDWNPC